MLRTVLLLDGSDAMNSSADYLPNYLLAMRPPLLRLVERYLDSTPLASLGLVVMRDGISHRLLPGTTNRNEIIDVLERDFFLHGGSGNTSLENGLRMAMSELVDMRKVAALAAAAKLSGGSGGAGATGTVPRAAAARDPRAAWKGSATQLNVILVSSSVTLIDPADVFAVVNTMAALAIRIHVVSLVGAVHVFDVCTAETGGTLYCPLNYDHLLDIVDELATAHRARMALARKRKQQQRRERQRRLQEGKRGRKEDGSGKGGGGDEGEVVEDASRLIPIGCPVYLEAPDTDEDGTKSVYLACPQCHLIQLAMPTTCPMCRLLLCSAPMLYSTYVSHNALVPPAKQLRVTRAAPASTQGATSPTEGVVELGSSVTASPEHPVRCSLCMVSIPAEAAAVAPARNGNGSGARGAAAVAVQTSTSPSSSAARVWQCGSCAAYRCHACHDFVVRTIGLCPHCVALQ